VFANFKFSIKVKLKYKNLTFTWDKPHPKLNLELGLGPKMKTYIQPKKCQGWLGLTLGAVCGY
jgi:hypothetical protein